MPIIADYLNALFRELERLWPTSGAASHGIAWDEDTEGLLLLFNVGDCVFPLPLRPGDLGDDPAVTAAHLAARGHAEIRKPENEYKQITFKR